MRQEQRKKRTWKRCVDCKYFNHGWCDIYFSRHEPTTSRCVDDYEPRNPFWMSGRFWLIMLIGLVVVAGIIAKLFG